MNIIHYPVGQPVYFTSTMKVEKATVVEVKVLCTRTKAGDGYSTDYLVETKTRKQWVTDKVMFNTLEEAKKSIVDNIVEEI